MCEEEKKVKEKKNIALKRSCILLLCDTEVIAATHAHMGLFCGTLTKDHIEIVNFIVISLSLLPLFAITFVLNNL
jgi:hypothetical protein